MCANKAVPASAATTTPTVPRVEMAICVAVSGVLTLTSIKLFDINAPFDGNY